MPPSSRAQRATPASTWSSRVTSMTIPRPRSSRAAASAPPAFTSATQTRAPSRANACAMASPMPLAAPVTSATLPERRMESSLADATIPCRDARRVVGSASHARRAASPRGVAIVPRFPRAGWRGPVGGRGRDPRHPRPQRSGQDHPVQLPLRVPAADRRTGSGRRATHRFFPEYPADRSGARTLCGAELRNG